MNETLNRFGESCPNRRADNHGRNHGCVGRLRLEMHMRHPSRAGSYLPSATGDVAIWSCPRCGAACGIADVRALFVELVRAVGGGFHPETRGEDYDFSAIEGWTAKSYEAVVEAFYLCVPEDPCGVALDVLHEAEEI